MAKFFFIKKMYKNTEELYWQNKEPKEFFLTKERAVIEYIGLSFYRLLGVTTPKTYLGEINGYAVIISKLMKHWSPLRFNDFDKSIPSLSTELQGLAELELASAVLSDIDVSGWCLDNIGYKKNNTATHVTKYDAGTAIIDENRKKYFISFFEKELSSFPEGIATLTEDSSLKTTYLKVFKEKSCCSYDKRYAQLFDNITPEHRKNTLLKLFQIDEELISCVIKKIPDSWYSPDEKEKCIFFILNRIEAFRKKFSTHFTPEELYPKEKLKLSLGFLKLKNQKTVIKKEWQEKYILDEEYKPLQPDYSQSGAGSLRFKRK